MMAICGGIYIVPLYAMIQTHTSLTSAHAMAASNMIDSIFMTIAAILSALLLLGGFSIKDLFLLLAATNLGVFLYARKLTSAPANPHSLLEALYDTSCKAGLNTPAYEDITGAKRTIASFGLHAFAWRRAKQYCWRSSASALCCLPALVRQ